MLYLICAASAHALDAPWQPIQVEIRGEPGHYQLYRDGKPYEVRGAGVSVVASDVGHLLERLKAHGGNSLRTWSVGDGQILDLAHELDLSVAICLDVKRERHGFDYNDALAVQRQFEQLEQKVRKFRNHPALLAWIIGNELNHDFTNPRVYDAVNEISKMIHALDPAHPTTTTTAGINSELANIIAARAPDLDFLSVQVYGGLFDLGPALAGVPEHMPIMVTEWGTIGHWEVPETDWGAPIELNSTSKAAQYRRGHAEVLKPLAGRLIGNYAFVWGQKQERTPTWYGVFVDEARTEAVDVLQQIWTQVPPRDQAPSIQHLSLDGKRAEESVKLLAGQRYMAEVQVSDRESRNLRFYWQLMEESRATQTGGDFEEVPPDRSEYLGKQEGSRSEVRAPQQPGPYRLFVYVHDEAGAVAHANIPFLVEAKKG